MAKIWFRVGMEAEISGKSCGGVDDYDNPDKEITFLF